MKRIALVALVFVVLLAFVAVAMAETVSVGTENFITVKQAKITVEEARKKALKKVDGKIESEFTIEDDDENVVSYVFVIRDKNNKVFEVEISAEDGSVVSAEEVREEPEEDEEPPATDENQAFEIVEIADETETAATSESAIQAKVTVEQARAAALKVVKGEIQSEELRTENGKVFYEIYVMDAEGEWFEIHVDGETGKAEKIENPDVE